MKRKTGSAKLITNYKDVSISDNNTTRMVLDAYDEIRQLLEDCKQLEEQLKKIVESINSDNIGGK